MIAVILAAGIGSRLRPLTDAVPKCLVPVAGVPILRYQLDAYLQAGLEKIAIVTGYRSDQVRRYVSSMNSSEIVLIENHDFLRTNNMYSLWLARDWIDDDLLLSNGDVIYDDQIIRSIYEVENGNYIAVDPGNYLEESMKVVVSDGKVTDISKTISAEEAYATSIDLYRLNPTATDRLFGIIEQDYVLADNLSMWTEAALQRLLAHEIVRPFDIGHRRWMEIDTPSDLMDAERLFGKSTNA